jgi:uncharacterized protein YndB with AHSA1/START domain
VEIVRSISIKRPVGEVFEFVADPRNDPRWCPKVRSVEPAGEGRYAVVHKPVPGKPERHMEMTRVAYEPPRRIGWREEDGVDVFEVTYDLEDLGGRTHFTQRSVAELGSSRLLRPLYRAGIGRDVAKQLKELRKLLEASS